MQENVQNNIAELIVRCLEKEGVEFVFGIPGEENIHLVDAFNNSSIRFILVRSEQGAAFMAEMYGRVSGKAGVCVATLGPGAINLLLGVADAHTNSSPLVALTAQVGLHRIYKETHQYVDLTTMFEPVTKSSSCVFTPGAVPEMLRSAFKTAQAERPGSVFLAVPEDIEKAHVPEGLNPLPINRVWADAPSPSQIDRAVKIINSAKSPVILAGHGAARNGASDALIRFSEKFGIPVATTFHAKGVFPYDHPNAVGTIGFMLHDYANFGFDHADVIICVGYELQEFSPAKINPGKDKKIIHIHSFPAPVDAYYNVAVGIEGDFTSTLDALCAKIAYRNENANISHKIRTLISEELERGRADHSCPLKPQRIVSDIREAMGRDDIVLADTGAVKMWMARLYPAASPNSCLVSNGLSSMGFALPGALGIKLAMPDKKVLAVMGDGSFLMNSQEIETALREKIAFVILVWVDNSYGLIKWKMDIALKHHSNVDFHPMDYVKYAESFGAKGYDIKIADELLPTLKKALGEDTVSLIACPVDYTENARLTDALGSLTQTL